MKNLFFISQSTFDFELKQDAKTVIMLFHDRQVAEATRDQMNMQLLVDTVAGFIAKHGGKVHYHFKAHALTNARASVCDAQEFVMRCNNLKHRKIYNPVFVWHLADEFLFGSIGYLKHDKQPYATEYGEVLHVITKYAELYSPTLMDTTKQSPAMQEFLSR